MCIRPVPLRFGVHGWKQGGVVAVLILVSALPSIFLGFNFGTVGEAVCNVLVFHTIFGGSSALCEAIPESSAMAACANCRYLHENSLDGKIPTELGLLTSLTQL